MSDSKAKILQRSRAVGNVEFSLYTEKYRNEALNVIRHFIRDSPFFIGAGIPENPESFKEMETVFSEVLKNNYVSVIAKEISTNQIIGVGVNTIEKKPISREESSEVDKIKDKYMQTENTRKLYNVWKYIFSKKDFFQEYNVDCILHFGHMTILPEYRVNRIGTKFYDYMLELYYDWYNYPDQALFIPEHLRHPPPQLATFLATSKYSQRMGKNTSKAEGHIIFPNTDFVLNGKSFADRIGEQDSVAILGVIKPKIYDSKL